MLGSFVGQSHAPVRSSRTSSWLSPKLGRRAVLVAMICGCTVLPVRSQNVPQQDDIKTRESAVSAGPSTRPELMRGYGKLALSFEPNVGQTDANVRFVARGSGYSLFLTTNEAVLAFKGTPSGAADKGSQTLLEMLLVGANAKGTIQGENELPGKSNYFVGSDSRNWKTNISNFAKVTYREIYPGIDLAYYGNQRELEYDFVVSPGADPKRIALKFSASGFVGRDGSGTAVRIDENGNLVIGSGAEQVQFRKPIIYQISDESGAQSAVRKVLDGSYVLSADNRVSFSIPEFDHNKPLIIDPVLTYSTYLGGLGTDAATSVAVDASFDVYIAGTTTSLQFPTSSGAYQVVLHDGSSCTNNSCGDAFVTKLDPTGSTILFSTSLGGSLQDIARAIAVDASGNSYITGSTNSPDFPTVSPLQASFGGGATDAFVAKIGPTGSTLLYSTYLGGNDLDQGNGIAVDGSGDAYVVGGTQSGNFAASTGIGKCQGGGILDAFITKLNPTGTGTMLNTCLGGSSADEANAVTLDSSGNPYIAGWTSSTNFPASTRGFQGTLKGAKNAFMALINITGGSISYASYLGGSGSDAATGVALDSVKNVYITGSTTSSNFPVTAGAAQTTYGGGGDAFIAKFYTPGSGSTSLIYSTYVGGSGNDAAVGITVDQGRNAYIAGYTSSSDFPMVSPVQSAFGGGATDAFAAQLNPAGNALLYSTYLGGSGAEDSNGLGGIAVDGQGSVYVVGSTNSGDFPVVSATAFQPNLAGGIDAFVSKIGDLSTPIPGLTLQWPLPNYQNRGITQENYSEFNFAGNHMYHTGFSLLAPAGTLVGAAADGNVVLIQLNPTKGSQCYDKGYGNTVFVEHDLPSGQTVYTQYSHLLTIDSTIQSQCGTANAEFSITCSTPIPVTALQSLGTVGHTACGYSDTNPSDTHLHLELKNFLGLVAAYGPGGAGYVLTPPDEYGLFNPLENLYPVVNLPLAEPMVVTGSSPVNILTGPGGGAGTAYRTINTVAPGTVLDARRVVAGATPVPVCNSEWYEVANINGTLFVDTFGSGTGRMLFAWICGDQLSPAGSTPPPQPVLSVSTTTLSFSATQGSGTNPTPANVTVSNTGTGALSFGASSDSSWLTVSPTSGAAPPSQTLQISATLGSLTAGTYTGHITVTASGAQGSPATITVTFTVAAPAPPSLTVSTTTLSFSATQGSGTNPTPTNITVSNSGGGTLSFTASSDSSWLTASPGSGSAPPSLTLQVSATLGTLTAGTYTGHITLTASGVQGSPATITVTFTVAAPPPPVLTLSSTTLSFSGTQGSGTNPTPANVTVSNTGSGTLSFTATSDSSWLAASPASGSAPPSQALQISATLGSLTAGTYIGHITVTASGAQGSPATITVTFTVAAPPPPILTLSANTLSFSATQASGVNPPPASVTLSNTGAGILSFTASSDSSWLAASPASGSAPPSQTLQVSATLGTLAAGTYTGHITVTATGATGSPAVITVTFVVSPPPPPPALSVSATTLTFNGTQGSSTNPAPASVTVSNTGSGTISFTASSDSTWLAVSPATGSAPPSQTLQVSATVGSLTAGTYTGHITVMASGASGSPATITVTFNVASPPPPAPPGGFFIRGVGKKTTTAATTIAPGYNAEPQQGDLLVAYIWWNSSSATISSVVDGCGNTWVATPAQTDTIDNAQAQLFYVAGSNACGSVDTVTVTFSATVLSRAVLGDWSGVGAGAVYYDVSAANFAPSTTTPLSSVSTSHAQDLIIQVAAGNNSGDNFTSAGAFTNRVSANGMVIGDSTVSAAQNYSTNLTDSATDNVFSGIFAFELTNAPAFPVQSNFNAVTATTISCSYPQSVKAGDLLAAYVWWQSPSTVTMSVADGVNGAWAAAGAQATETALPHSAQLFYFANTAAGPITITATPSNGTSQPMYMECTELAGMGTSNVLDGTPATASNSTKAVTSLSVGPVTTSGTNDLLLLGCGTNDGNRFSVPTGFTQLQSVNHEVLFVGPASSPGNYSTACEGGGAAYTGNLAAFQ